MRWKFLRLQTGEPDHLFPDRLDGTVEQAMEHLMRLVDSRETFIAASDGPPSAFGLPQGWLFTDVEQHKRRDGWTPSHGLFKTPREALDYELQRAYTHPRLFRVIRRDGSVAQIILQPGTHYQGHGGR